MTTERNLPLRTLSATLLSLCFCAAAPCRAGQAPGCLPEGGKSVSPPDFIALPTPRPEYLRDVTPALRESGLLQPGQTMDAELFGRLGGMEKSMLVYHPRALVPVDSLEGSICRSFKKKRREYALVKAMVVQLNGCRYCVGGAVKALRGLVDEEALVQAVLRDPKSARANRREKAVLDYARVLTVSPKEVSQAHIDALRKAGLDDRDIFDLAMLTGWVNFLSRLGAGLSYSLDPGREVLYRQAFDKEYEAPAACQGPTEWPPSEGRDRD